MLADLVNVTTPEGIALSGAYFTPANEGRSHSVDAMLFFHGDGGHFYSSLYLGLGRRMAEKGIAFLTANRRSHDHVASGVRGGPLAGCAFDKPAPVVYLWDAGHGSGQYECYMDSC